LINLGASNNDPIVIRAIIATIPEMQTFLENVAWSPDQVTD
jgi:hypothetical protein